jgi:hypothetical protein
MTSHRWIVYDRSDWRDFLLGRILRDHASVFRAEPSDRCDDLIGLVDGARGFIFHLDCTLTSRFPFCRDLLVERFLSAGRIVINARAVDLRKTTIQQICAGLSLPTTLTTSLGPPGELVVVKTDFNARGAAERRLPKQVQEDLGLSCPETVISRLGYRVMPRIDVPPGWWTDPSLAIERFIANRSDVYYRVYVCRERMAIACAFRPGRIKKMVCGATRHVQLVNLSDHEESVQLDVAFPLRPLRRFLRHLGLDFGTLDVVRDDEPTFYVIDANTTPYWCEQIPGVLSHLAEGLYAD